MFMYIQHCTITMSMKTMVSRKYGTVQYHLKRYNLIIIYNIIIIGRTNTRAYHKIMISLDKIMNLIFDIIPI